MKKLINIFALSMLVMVWNCGSDSGNGGQQSGSAQQTQNTGGLSQWELEHGIGPVKSPLQLGAVDKAMAEEGAKVFEMKCTACHRLDERYVGPPLRNVTQRRTPEYIMNMILNPDEMVKSHPEAKKLLAEYLAPMTNQNLKPEEARAILEYFRSEEK